MVTSAEGEEAQEPEMGTRTSGAGQAGPRWGRGARMGPGEGELELSGGTAEPGVTGACPRRECPRETRGSGGGGDRCWLRGVMLAAGPIVIGSNKKKG